ncbi:14686_t:CDS:1, partial [Gigaspora rosea]
SRENNSPTLESREEIKILSGYAIVSQPSVASGYKCTAGFWVRQQGLAYLATVGHCALNNTPDQHHTLDQDESVRFYFIEPDTEQQKFLGNMTRFDTWPVDRGFILPVDGYSESPFIYSKELKGPLFAIADFARTPNSYAEGTILCKSGSGSGYTCGVVTSVKVNIFLYVRGYGVLYSEGQSELSKTRSELGDTGSPVFSFSNPLTYQTGVNLLGLVIGRLQFSVDKILFTPIYKILDSDMNVITIHNSRLV